MYKPEWLTDISVCDSFFYHHPWEQFTWLQQRVLVKYLVNNITEFGMDDNNLPIFQQWLSEYKRNWIQKWCIFTQKRYEQQIFIFLLSTLKICGVGVLKIIGEK